MSKSVKGNTKKVEEPRATKSKVTKTVEDEMKDATKKSTKGSTATKTTKSVEDTGLGQKRKAAAKTPVVESDVESGANDSETEFMAVSGMSDEEGYDFADVEGGSDNEAEEDDAEETPIPKAELIKAAQAAKAKLEANKAKKGAETAAAESKEDSGKSEAAKKVKLDAEAPVGISKNSSLEKKDRRKRMKLDEENAKRPWGPKPDRGVICVSRIPFGFFEDEMRTFFEQFGTVTRVRLSRNKYGRSRHYGFVEFEDKEVANIVADTMDGYMMFGRILQVQYIPYVNVHPDTFKFANKPVKIIDWEKRNRKKVNVERTAEQVDAINQRNIQREAKLRKKLAEMGLDYDFSGFEGKRVPEYEEVPKPKAAPAAAKKASKATPPAEPEAATAPVSKKAVAAKAEAEVAKPKSVKKPAAEPVVEAVPAKKAVVESSKVKKSAALPTKAAAVEATAKKVVKKK